MPRGVSIVDQARIAGRLWSPIVLRPYAWYDASDLSTVTTSGTTVTEWRDKMQNRNLANASGRTPELLYPRWTDLPVMSLSSTAYFTSQTQISSYWNSTTFSCMFVSRPITANNQTTYYVASHFWGDSGGWTGYSGNSSGTAYGYTNGAAPTRTYTLGSPSIFYSEYANGSMTNRVNDGPGASSADGIPPRSDTLLIGSGYTNAAMTQELGEWIWFQTSLTSSERQLVAAYLAWKWGTQTSLSVDNPYLLRPPLIGD